MMNLSQRDKKILIAGTIFLIIFASVRLIYFPAVEKKEMLRQMVDLKKTQFEEMIQLQDKFQSISNQTEKNIDDIKTRDKNFSLFSFIDNQVQQCGIKENVDFMKPYSSEIEKSEYRKATVKIKLNNIYLKELVDFLYKVESSKNSVIITSLSLLRTGKEEFRLDALIETETLIPKESE